MTQEELANIGVSGKGYWLFDRNGAGVKKGEAIRSLCHNFLVVAKKDYSDEELMLMEPWAIYKWIPADRS